MSARQAAGAEPPRALFYILVAEFDIGKGSTLKYSYPGKIEGYDDSQLAEWMLPEGAHKREDDWTYFFLNRGALSPDSGARKEGHHATTDKVFLRCINNVQMFGTRALVVGRR